jgi:hypothetical protein
MWAALEPLLAERPQGDAAAAFERGSLHATPPMCRSTVERSLSTPRFYHATKA